MKKRVLSMILAVMLLCTSFPVHAHAAQDEKQMSPYTVTMQATPDPQMMDAGDTVTIRVGVSSVDKNVTKYSAYDLRLSYDAKLLTYESGSAPDANTEISVKNGKIRVKGYGDDKSLTTAAVTLVFRIKAEGDAIVTLESAKIDFSDNAGVQNAPLANVTEKDLVIRARTFYAVTINGDGVISDSRVASSYEDYTFRVEDPKLYDYEITVKVGGADITGKLIYDAKTGTYTIPKEYITGDITVTASRSPKQFDVIIKGKDVTGADTATYLTDYKFALKREKGYLYTISVTIDGKAYTGFTEKEDVYTIPGADITGNIKITVTKNEDEANKVNVTFTGSGAKDASGEKKATKGDEYSFKINKAKGYTYGVTVSVGGKTVTCKYDTAKKTYSIPGDKVTDDITITITKIATVEVTEYITMDEESMYLILYRGNVGNDQVPKYDGKSMYWSDLYGCYAFLIVSSTDAEEVKPTAEEKITLVKGSSAGSVNYSGNVNLSLHTDMDDMQLIRDMYDVRYSLENMDMLKFLNADINGDRKVDIRDVAALICRITKGEVERT